MITWSIWLALDLLHSYPLLDWMALICWLTLPSFDKDRYHVILSRDNRVLSALSDNTAVQIDLRTEREGKPQVVTKKDFITQFELQPEQWPILWAM